MENDGESHVQKFSPHPEISAAASVLRGASGEAPGEIKMYLVTSDFHCPRSEFIFRTVVVQVWVHRGG